jgi:hypothetical protein
LQHVKLLDSPGNLPEEKLPVMGTAKRRVVAPHADYGPFFAHPATHISLSGSIFLARLSMGSRGACIGLNVRPEMRASIVIGLMGGILFDTPPVV